MLIVVTCPPGDEMSTVMKRVDPIDAEEIAIVCVAVLFAGRLPENMV